MRRNPIEELFFPAHVSKRCGAAARSTGASCKRWAAVGSSRCKFHGGARGSGRPREHGRRSATYLQQKRVMKLLVKLMHEQHGQELHPKI